MLVEVWPIHLLHDSRQVMIETIKQLLAGPAKAVRQAARLVIEKTQAHRHQYKQWTSRKQV